MVGSWATPKRFLVVGGLDGDRRRVRGGGDPPLVALELEFAVAEIWGAPRQHGSCGSRWLQR